MRPATWSRNALERSIKPGRVEVLAARRPNPSLRMQFVSDGLHHGHTTTGVFSCGIVCSIFSVPRAELMGRVHPLSGHPASGRNLAYGAATGPNPLVSRGSALRGVGKIHSRHSPRVTVDGRIRLHPLAEKSGKEAGPGRTDHSCCCNRVLRASAEELHARVGSERDDGSGAFRASDPRVCPFRMDRVAGEGPTDPMGADGRRGALSRGIAVTGEIPCATSDANEKRSIRSSSADGAFGRLAADSLFAGFEAAAELGGWRLALDTAMGLAAPDARGGVIDRVSPLTTTAMSVRADRRRTNRDEITVSLSQPPRIESGSAVLRVPVGRTMDGRIVVERTPASPEPSPGRSTPPPGGAALASPAAHCRWRPPHRATRDSQPRDPLSACWPGGGPNSELPPSVSPGQTQENRSANATRPRSPAQRTRVDRARGRAALAAQYRILSNGPRAGAIRPARRARRSASTLSASVPTRRRTGLAPPRGISRGSIGRPIDAIEPAALPGPLRVYTAGSRLSAGHRPDRMNIVVGTDGQAIKVTCG